MEDEQKRSRTALHGLLIPAVLVLLALGVVRLAAVTSTAGDGESSEESEASQDTPEDARAIAAVSESPLPPNMPASAPGEGKLTQEHVRTVTVERGDTLLQLLTDGGLSHDAAAAVVEAIAPHYDPARLRPGQEIRFLSDGSIEVATSVQNRIVVRRGEGSVQAELFENPLESRETVASGTVLTSLYGAGREAGLPNGLLMQLINLLAFEVDLQREIHPGDSFEVLYERHYDREGNFVRAGNLLAAEVELRHETIGMYRFLDSRGRVDYFDADGTTIRKTLLRTPIDGARITSGFGYRRHPVRGYSHLHRGVDFAGPVGTPVYAAGSGQVQTLRFTHGYGNHIAIRHRNGYRTLYAHLDAFARGMQAGRWVEQGQLIGYLGNTGLSTGPHLHYEVYYNGSNVNPASLSFPPERSLSAAELGSFAAVRDALDRILFGRKLDQAVLTN